MIQFSVADSKSFSLTKKFLGSIVKVKVDRPLGSTHPKWGFVYESNYGYIEGVLAPDGEELDAYVLKVNHAVNDFEGSVVAIVHRLKDDDDKLVVVSKGETITDKEIEEAVAFQEKWFEHEIVR